MKDLVNILYFLYVAILAFWACIKLMPYVIRLVQKYKLMDAPNERKMHKTPKPSMGGLGVVGIILIITTPLLAYDTFENYYFIVISLFAFVALGFIDDWKNISAKYKFVFQILFSVTAYYLGFKIDNFFGFLGIFELAPIISFILTITLHVLLINAYNLIDGIDGLLGGILLLNLLAFGIIFLFYGHFHYSIISFIAIGSIIGFLKFNLYPSQIFMGDTGSLPLGALMSIFSFKTINFVQNDPNIVNTLWLIPLVVAINGIPMFDTIRVFGLRMLKGRSPFSADKSHIHHLYIKNGFGHYHGSMFIHTIHLSIIVLSVVIVKYLTIDTGIMYVVFIILVSFELSTVVRMKDRMDKKEILFKQRKGLIKRNRFLNKLA